jgi:hypothetical protein
VPSDNLILGNLLHLSYNMWGDWNNPKMGKYWASQPYLRFDEKLWDDLLEATKKAGGNLIIIDLGDAVRYESHPEIAVENAWTRERLRREVARLRDMGLEPIPKLNFSTCHDQWLGPYARMVSTEPYYKVCKDLIEEVIDLFDKPRFFHLGMDEEEVHHQEQFQLVTSRKFDLWWHDLGIFLKKVQDKGVRPWVWSDYVWNHAEEFYAKMPRNVIQSNWYRHPVSGPCTSVYGGVVNMDIPCCKAFVELDQAGFDQLPTISNWETPDNIYNTIRFCKEHLSRERLKGFLLTPWRPTLESAREKHMDCIEHFGKAIREILR